jgi:flagellar biosynthesis/type III secretory pathway M-ring protein FliF/YscJ
LRPFEQEKIANLTQVVCRVLGGIDEANVQVVTYADEAFAGEAGLLPVAAANRVVEGSMISSLVHDYGKTAAVVALAAAALFLVGAMAKKGSMATVATSGPVRLPEAGAFGDLLGTIGEPPPHEAMGADPLLMGQEIAEDQLQAGQMVEQVQSLVKENPDAAASLVKRWMNV